MRLSHLKKALFYILHFSSSRPKRFKGKLFKALMPTILYLFIFCNSGVVYRRILNFPLLRFYNYHLGLKALPQLHSPSARVLTATETCNDLPIIPNHFLCVSWYPTKENFKAKFIITSTWLLARFLITVQRLKELLWGCALSKMKGLRLGNGENLFTKEE